MPEAVRHQSQVDHNKHLLGEALFRVDESSYPDWIVTIAFYAAMHSVDRELADLGLGDPRNHEVRRFLIRNRLGNSRIWGAYEALEEESRKARYECVKFDPDRVKEALALLTRIESALAA